MSAPLTNDVRGAATVHGVHGTSGVSYWKCLTRRLGLAADWEAFEWACLPPGAISGEHLHTRTEELYLILSGRGRIFSGDESWRVGPADLVVTPVGARHGLVNEGDEPLAWLVLEVSSPAQAAALAGRPHGTRTTPTNPPTTKAVAMSLSVINLQAVERFSAPTVLRGPLRDVRIARLAAGDELDLRADGVEYATFTVGGRGVAADGETRIALEPGVAVTLPLGTRVTLRAAGNEPLELFVACLAVDGEVVA